MSSKAFHGDPFRSGQAFNEVYHGAEWKVRAADLRAGDPAILARVHEDAVLLDPRTLSDEEVEVIVRRVGELGSGS